MDFITKKCGKFSITDLVINNRVVNREVSLSANNCRYLIRYNDYKKQWFIYNDYGLNGKYPAVIMPFWDMLEGYDNKYNAILDLYKALKLQQEYYKEV